MNCRYFIELVADRDRRRIGEPQIDHFDLVAALGVEADRGAHQRGNAVDLFLGARLIDHLAFGILDVAAIDQHGGRDAVDAAGLDHLGLGGARNFVIDDFLGLLALIALAAGGAAAVLVAAGQFVGDRDWAAFLAVIGGRLFFAGLARAHDAAVRIELVGRLGDAVEVEIGVELDARLTGADHRGDDLLDLLAQAVFVSQLALVGAAAAQRIFLRRPVGEQPAGLVDDRDALRLHAVDRRRHQMADGAHLLRLERAAHLQDHRGGGFDLVAREQGALRQHQMNARGLDAVEAADGAGQFAFQRAQMIDVLDEGSGAERVGFVEDFVADAAAFGLAAFGELHAQAGDLVLRHHHDRVLDRQVGEQRHHGRRRHLDHQEGEEADERQRHRRHRRHSRRTERFHKVEKALHRSVLAEWRPFARYPASFAQYMVSVWLTSGAPPPLFSWRGRLARLWITAARCGFRT